jgi:hypothetical protein
MDPFIDEAQDCALTSPHCIPPVFAASDFLTKLANNVKTENPVKQSGLCIFIFWAFTKLHCACIT